VHDPSIERARGSGLTPRRLTAHGPPACLFRNFETSAAKRIGYTDRGPTTDAVRVANLCRTGWTRSGRFSAGRAAAAIPIRRSVPAHGSCLRCLRALELDGDVAVRATAGLHHHARAMGSGDDDGRD
jgi:hypothetical protein